MSTNKPTPTVSPSAPSGPGPRYVDLQAAAAYMSVSASWVRKATRAGEIPYAKLGARVVYDRLDLDEVIRRSKINVAWARQGYESG